jgi:hypothetical protein
MTTINLAETIAKNLGLPPLHKVNPNTQEVTTEKPLSETDKLSQAAIPAVLSGLYLFATYKEGAEAILGGNSSTDWVDTVFKTRKNEAVDRIARYAGVETATAEDMMQKVAREAISIIRAQIPTESHPNQLNEFFTRQRDSILQYLPAALQMGQLLKDDTLDDRTNKMRGPVSGFMHQVEKVFSSGTKDTKPGLF